MQALAAFVRLGQPPTLGHGMATAESDAWQLVENPTGEGSNRLPSFLRRLVSVGDQVQVAKGNGSSVLIRSTSGRTREMLHARIGPVTPPRLSAQLYLNTYIRIGRDSETPRQKSQSRSYCRASSRNGSGFHQCSVPAFAHIR